MVSCPMTLNDPNLDFKVTILLNVKQLENGTRQSDRARPILTIKKSYMVY